jgi:hypothetical protein
MCAQRVRQSARKRGFAGAFAAFQRDESTQIRL